MLARLERPSRGWLIVACGAVLFAALFTWFGEQRLYGLHAGRDLGLFLQSLLGVAHGAGMQNTIEGNHFAVHDSPILLLAVPLVALWPAPHALIVASAALIGAGALPLYALALALGNPPRRAAALALLYLGVPAVHGFAFYNDFNENIFIPVLAFGFAWAYVSRRDAWLAVCGLGLLLIKEDQGIFIAWIAVLLATRSTGTRRVVLLALAALGILTITIYLLTHHSIAGARFYAGDPLSGTWAKAGSLLELLAPLAFLPLFARGLWWLAVPILVELYAASAGDIFRIGSHYEISFVAFLFVAAAAALCKMTHPRRWLIAAAALALTLIPLTDPSPLHLGPRYRYSYALDAPFLAGARARLETGASVSVPEEYFPFVADFPNAHWSGSRMH